MTITEATTLIIALAALVTSIVTAIEMVRQRENSVRPVLVVLDKYTKNEEPEGGRSLFLVNMGQALAIGTRLVASNGAQISELPLGLALAQTEVFPGRRVLLASGFAAPVASALTMMVVYQDLNGNQYFTQFEGGSHRFGRGLPPHVRR